MKAWRVSLVGVHEGLEGKSHANLNRAQKETKSSEWMIG